MNQFKSKINVSSKAVVNNLLFIFVATNVYPVYIVGFIVISKIKRRIYSYEFILKVRFYKERRISPKCKGKSSLSVIT